MKRILIVEDKKDSADHIVMTLRGEGREVKWRDNRDEAIDCLNSWVPDILVLDLEIFKSPTEKTTTSRDYGVEVADKANDVNNKLQSANIQIVFLTANLQESHVKRLIKNRELVRQVVDKGNRDHLKQLADEVNGALLYPRNKEETIAYKDFRPELYTSLQEIRGYLCDLLREIEDSFSRKEYGMCIIQSWSFVKCLYDEIILKNQGIEILKQKWNNYNREQREGESEESWSKKFTTLVNKNSIRDMDKQYAICVRHVRNIIAHHGAGSDPLHKPTMDDAASVMRLLVPLISSYVRFCKKSS